jgi:SAM-dependent methyltransferase
MSGASQPCPICSHQPSKVLGQSKSHKILACNQCGHWWADGIEPLHEAREFLEQYCNFSSAAAAAESSKLRRDELDSGPLQRTNALLREVLGDTQWQGSSHLDVGCGSGFLLAQSKAAGLEVQGIDPGPWSNEASRRWKIPIEREFLREQHFNRGFDLVTATDVIEHQADPVPFLQRLATNLTPRGLIILTFPCTDSFNARILGTRWSMVAPPTHCQFFSHASAVKLADRCDLRIVAHRQYNAGGFPVLSRFNFFTNFYSRLLNRLNLGDQLLIALRPKTHS